MIEQQGEPIPCWECGGSGFEQHGGVCGNCHGGYVGMSEPGAAVSFGDQVARMVVSSAKGAGVIAGVGAGMKRAIISIIEERKRQDGKWGQQNHDPIVWSAILGEEVGELCQAIIETHFDNGPELKAKGGHENMRAEAVQVAAVAEAFIEYLDRLEDATFNAPGGAE